MQQTQGTPIVHSRPSALRYSTPSTSQHLTGTPTPITPSRHQRASPARSVVSNVNSSNLDTEQRSIESNAYASIFNNALRQPIVPLPPNPPISTRSQSIPYIPIDPALLNHAAEQESAAPPPSENATSEVETLRRARPIRRTPKAKATEAESGTTVAPAAPVTKKKRARRPKTKDQDTPPENAGGEGEAVPTPQPSAPLEARTSLAEEQAENRKRASRKKRKSVVVEDPDGGGDQSDTSYNPTKKPKRSRKKVTNPDDPDADASTPIRRPRKPKTQEQIALEDAESAAREHDPTSTTMSDLTTDLPIGKATADRVSKIKKMAESRKRDREARFKIKEMDKLISFGKTVERIEREKEGERERERIENELAQGIDMDEDYIATAFGAATATDDEDDEIGFSGLKDSAMVPQVRMDASGNIVIDDLNMEVDRGGAGANDEEYEVVVERESDRFVNSSTHSKKIRGSKWTADETAVFYHYLSMYGTDFESIARLMRLRTRREVKNKYNAEDRKNPNLVTFALMRKLPMDIEEHARLTGVDLSGPPPEILPPKQLIIGEPIQNPTHPIDEDEATSDGGALSGIDVDPFADEEGDDEVVMDREEFERQEALAAARASNASAVHLANRRGASPSPPPIEEMDRLLRSTPSSHPQARKGVGVPIGTPSVRPLASVKGKERAR